MPCLNNWLKKQAEYQQIYDQFEQRRQSTESTCCLWTTPFNRIHFLKCSGNIAQVGPHSGRKNKSQQT